MELESLVLDKSQYGEQKGRVTGTIRFRGEHGSIGLTLSPEDCNAILRLCADRLVAQSKQIATDMTASIIEHAGHVAIEGPKA